MSRLMIDAKRIRIRNLRLSDLANFHSYRSDPVVTKYQGFDVFSLEQAKAFIEEHAEKQFGTPGDWVQYAIQNKATSRLVGDCAIKLNQQDTRLAEIGITIAPREQKKGFAKEALVSILSFLFSLKDFHRVTEIVDAENIASIRLLESVGFRLEGHFVENIFFKGKWGSEYQYAMLKDEWLQLKERKL